MKLPRALQDIHTIKTLLTAAEAEAQRAGDDLPGPEHLLLAAFDLPDGTARRAFERLGVEPAAFRAAIDVADTGAEPPAAAPASGVYRLTAPGQHVFQSAVSRAKAAEPTGLRGGHIVAAVSDQRHGTAARALRTLGVDPAALNAAAGAALAER
jgi:ATP-dependent Clp protease ATP-binding subunit ClpA